jgi:anhydro-N-acetylmuramic acid kinase
MIVAGVMSGTSADGINVALAEIMGRGLGTRLRLLAHHEFAFPVAVRRKVLALMNAERARVADLSQLNFLLAELYAKAVRESARRAGVAVKLAGCHGQTLYHQGEATKFLGARVASTWQTGEGAVLAARLGVAVVSDFRTADMAAGGKGAPLVPYLDYLLLRDRRRGRIVQNLGGIGNITAIPAGAAPEEVIAFDTGPGNMVIDQAMEQLFQRRYDRGGRIAASGRVLDEVVRWAMRAGFFAQQPPRTAGREQFGREFVAAFLRRCGRAKPEDIVATATALTARSIGDALKRFVVEGTGRGRPVSKGRPVSRGRAVSKARPVSNGYRDYVVSGGGAENPTLMRMIAAEVEPLGLTIRRSDEFGVPSAAKEALAFAVLAYQTWHREPSNIPSATGAKRPAILGKVSYP